MGSTPCVSTQERRGTVGSGHAHMLRLLALLIICMVSFFFMQGEPAFAHGGTVAPVQPLSLRHVDAGPVFTAPSPANDCPSQVACCTMVCAPCKLPMPGHRAEFVWRSVESSAIPALRDDCLRSAILSRDPPVPRSHFL